MTPGHRAAALRLAHGGLAPRRIDRLLGRDGSVEALVAAIVASRTALPAPVQASISMPAKQRSQELADRAIEFRMPGDVGVPWHRLSRFASAPRWLFAKGPWPDQPTIAIVGTRSCTAYGEDLAHRYGATSAEAGWLVVSGMAKGIDGAAHRGALDAGGSTVAVLGSGVDVVYPRRHRTLYERILASGAIVSEYPPGTRPDAWRFPTRNRIIAASADVVLVVEAGDGGGALITAGVAVDQGTPVFATPGDVDRPASTGTNRLIRDGAFPVFDADDLRQVLDLVVPFAATASTAR